MHTAQITLKWKGWMQKEWISEGLHLNIPRSFQLASQKINGNENVLKRKRKRKKNKLLAQTELMECISVHKEARIPVAVSGQVKPSFFFLL